MQHNARNGPSGMQGLPHKTNVMGRSRLTYGQFIQKAVLASIQSKPANYGQDLEMKIFDSYSASPAFPHRAERDNVGERTVNNSK